MFKHFILLALLVFITPQFLFSQDDGKYVLYNHESYTVADLKLTNMLVLDVQPRGNVFQVTGTYYEYHGKDWTSIGEMSGTLGSDGSFKGTGKIVTEGEFNLNGGIKNGYASIGKEKVASGYSGTLVKDISGIYYKDGNEDDVCRVAQNGPFLELIDENNNTSKGVIRNEMSLFAIDWNMQGGFGEKDKITFENNVKWTKSSGNAKGYTGNWLTSYGELKLEQSGSKVTGKNVYNPTTVDGAVTQSGDTLIFTGKWNDGSNNGDVIFKLFKDDFRGKWNYSTSPNDWKEDWHGTRMADK
jgi:hypothetical protein